MKLLIFDKNSSKSEVFRQGMRSISMNRKNSMISFSKAVQQELQIKDGKLVMFAQDEDSKDDWYICVTDDNDGIPVHSKKNGGYGSGYLSTCIFNKMLSNKLLDVVKADKSATFLISAKPVTQDGKDWYKIVMAKPLTKK